MIEVEGLARADVLALAASTLAAQLELDARQLQLAAHWADLHHPASVPPASGALAVARQRLDGDHPVQPGGEGTPAVLARCPAELGLVLQTSAGGAKHLVADALDLRHRLPTLWAEVQAGQVRAWKARRVAQATRHLPLAVMREVDRSLAGLLPTVAWTRFEAVLEATVKRADLVGARAAEAEAASRRFVSLARPGPADAHGLRTVIARGETLDILTFLAAVNRLAEILGVQGDDASVEVRRSKAVGILGQPDRALALLAAHRHDDDLRHSDLHGDGGRGSEACEPDDEAAAPGPEEDPDSSRSLDLGSADVRGSTSSTGTGVQVQLYVHLTDAALRGIDPAAVCRVEGVGPLTAATVRRWLCRDDIRITVRPVVVPGDAVPVDAYEIPHRIREAVQLRSPASAYPWSACTDRRALQLDHVQPWCTTPGQGPPGRTDPANLAPLTQPEHQRKTSRRWQERSPAAGVCLWRSPHGWVTLVTNQGTFPLGHGEQAQAIWRASAVALALAV